MQLISTVNSLLQDGQKGATAHPLLLRKLTINTVTTNQHHHT